MVQRPAVAGLSRLAHMHEPAVTEIMPLHAFLFGRGYLSPERNRKDTASKSLAYTLGHTVHGGLKPDYLAHAFKIEKGLSWGKMFGNFMATAAGFRAVLHTVRQDERGFVVLHDSLAIRGLFVALHEFRKAVKEIEGRDVSGAMERSAAFCGGLVDKLQQLFHESGHWATIAADGETIVENVIDRQALADPRLKKLPLVEKASGAVTLLTASGLEAFKAWADKAADMNRFMNSVQVPPEAVVGTDQPVIVVEKYVRRGGLPAPHPSYASPVYRVMVELMAIAEQNSMPELEFRYNGWRRAYEARVPVDHADEFLGAVKNNAEMGSLCGEHDWWVERVGEQVGEQVRVVIPTQPAIHVKYFTSFSKSLMEKVAALHDHFQRVHHQEAVDLDAYDKRDENDSSIRMKLKAFEETFQELEGMQAFLEAERDRDPNLKTQESLAVSALIDRLMFLTQPYRDVYLQRDEPEKLAGNIGEALSVDVFNLLEHMPDHSDRVPRVDVFLAGPKFPFTPKKWVEPYLLLIKLYERMVDIAGAFDEDPRFPVNVEVSYGMDIINQRIKLKDLTRRFTGYFGGLSPDMEPHLLPGPAREIYALAKKAAPKGRMLSVDGDLMYVPIEIKNANLIDSRGVPQSPSMARFSKPHPSLFGPQQGEG